MKKVMLMVAALASLAFAARAAVEVEPLSVQEMARYGATHMVELESADLDATVTANVAQTNVIYLPGPLCWEYRGFSCDTPFNDTKVFATNGLPGTTNSIALTVTLDAVTLVAGLQVAGDQTRTYKTWIPTSGTAASTAATRVLTNVIYEAGGTTGNVTVATGSIASTAVWPYAGVIASGSTGTLTVVTGAPGAGSSLGNLTRGRARVFLRIFD